MSLLDRFVKWISGPPAKPRTIADRLAELERNLVSDDPARGMGAEQTVRSMVDVLRCGVRPRYSEAYVLGAIRLVRQYGHAVMLGNMRNLGDMEIHSEKDSRVAEAARECQQVLEARVEAERQLERRKAADARLLRPADAPGIDALLRPTQPSSEHELLRPVCGYDEQESGLERSR